MSTDIPRDGDAERLPQCDYSCRKALRAAMTARPVLPAGMTPRLLTKEAA